MGDTPSSTIPIMAKHVFIAGASSDIGLEIAKTLTEEGYALILHANSDSGRSKLEQEFQGQIGAAHQIVQCDFSNPEAMSDRLAPIFKQFSISGLVNCVGIRSRRPLKLLKPAHVSEVLNINFLAFIELCRIATSRNHFKPGLSMVQISSISAQSGGASVTAYAASKAASDAAVRSLAKELSPKSIRINSLLCGQVDSTEYHKLMEGKSSDPVMERQYLGLVQTREIADLVLFLLSEKSGKMSGQLIPVDGGFLQ